MTKNQPPGRSPDNQYPELADELERVLNLMLDSGEACRVDGDFDEWIDFTHGVSLALRLDVIAERSGTSTEGNLAGRDQDDHTVYLESALITAVANPKLICHRATCRIELRDIRQVSLKMLPRR